MDEIRRKLPNPNSVDMASAVWEEERIMDQSNGHIYLSQRCGVIDSRGGSVVSEVVEMRKCVKSSCTGLVLKWIELGGGENPLYERRKKNNALRSDGAPLSIWAMGIRHAFNDSGCRRLIDLRRPHRKIQISARGLSPWQDPDHRC